MSDLDRKIRDALKQEDAELFEEFDQEPSLFDMAMLMFRQRSRWIIAMVMVGMLVFMALLVYSIARFVSVESERDMLMWAGVGIFSMGAVAMLKVWSWMEINKNFVTREIKRVELQIARLAARLRDQ